LSGSGSCNDARERRHESWSFTFNLCAASVVALAAISGRAAAQAPRANGDTLNVQHYAGPTGNMHAIVAREKGFCEKYVFFGAQF